MICRSCFPTFVHRPQSPFGRWDVVKLQGAPGQGQCIVSRIRLELRNFATPFESRPISGTFRQLRHDPGSRCAGRF